MKNPFLDTSKYAVVRQFKRLASKKRSVSETGIRQNKKSPSRDFYQSDYQFTDSLNFLPKHRRNYSNFQRDEYQLRSNYNNRIIQPKRPSIFNVQQLRYYSNFIKNSSKNFTNIFQCQYYKFAQSSQKCDQIQVAHKNKQLDCEFSSRNKQDNIEQSEQIKENSEIYQQDVNHEPNMDQSQQYQLKVILSDANKRRIERRESSLGGTMLVINSNNRHIVRNDQYGSIQDMQQQNLVNENIIIKRSTVKKPSIFQQLRSKKKVKDDQQEKQNQSPCTSGQIIVAMQKKQRNSLRNQQKINPRKLKDQILILQNQRQKPPFIRVRGKVYYYNQKIRKKY